MKTRSWNELEKSIAESLNFMQTADFRYVLYNLADYVSNFLNSNRLAFYLKQTIDHRVSARNQQQDNLVNLRKMLKDEHMESTKL